MRKFKLILYGIYIFYFAFSAFIAFFYEDIVLRWGWDWISTWTGLIRFVLQMGAIGSILFITEIITENIHLFSTRIKIKALGKEVLDLKAKLYDQDISKETGSIEKITPNSESENKNDIPEEK